MKITKIRIEELFGELTYDIPLKASEFATIIYAPNGYGKTSVLEIVDALFKLNFYSLSRYKFAAVSIHFADQTILSIERKAPLVPDDELLALLELDETIKPSTKPPAVSFQVRFKGPNREIKSFKVSPEIAEGTRPTAEAFSRWIEENVSELERVGQLRWIDRRTGEMMRLPDLAQRYSYLFPGAGFKVEDWLREFMDTHRTSLIKTKRLDAELVNVDGAHDRYRDQRRPVPSVIKHSQELVREIQKILAEFSNLSQKLDHGFPGRLVRALVLHQHPSVQQDALQRLDKKYNQLLEAGLLDRELSSAVQLTATPAEALKGVPDPKLREVVNLVMDLYIQDQQQKFAVYDPLLEKIETIRSLINSRFQRKHLTVNPATGYENESTKGEKIPLDRLSSGEQHELVLFHSLLFGLRPHALVMIDEPEISLHVAWQQEFLRDLARISRNTGAHFLIATHSPQIISDRWDLTVDLTQTM